MEEGFGRWSHEQDGKDYLLLAWNSLIRCPQAFTTLKQQKNTFLIGNKLSSGNKFHIEEVKSINGSRITGSLVTIEIGVPN